MLPTSLACISWASTGRIFVKFDIGDFHENVSTKSKFGYNLTQISGTLHEDLNTFILFYSDIKSFNNTKVNALFSFQGNAFIRHIVYRGICRSTIGARDVAGNNAQVISICQ
jgi:hypothetical protein